MRFDVVTLFTGSFHGPFAESIVARAVKSGIIQINIVDLRDYTDDRRRTVDDTPYGGGPGMLMKPEPLFKAVESLRADGSLVVYTSPAGRKYDQKTAEALSKVGHVILICGHYEGVDQRVLDTLVDMELSIGDYVVTNGNIPAMVIIDSVSRLLPGVLGHPDSACDESFAKGMLEYPQYTKPAEFRGLKVPDILLSGDHKKISEWRCGKAFETTMERRPDLLT